MELHHGKDWVLIRTSAGLLAFRPSDSSLLTLPGRTDAGAPLAAILARIESLARPPLPLNRRIIEEYWASPRLSVSALNLNLTDRCNLACVYCYAKGGNYERIHAQMTPEAAKDALKKAFARADPDLPFRIEFFGGEPLLNPRTIEAVLDLQSDWDSWKSFPPGTANRISTNLTVLTPEMADLLNRGRMTVSVSLDGPAGVQDEQRPFKDGRPSFSTIFENLVKVRERCPEQTMVARMTVYHHPEALPGAVREFAASGLFDYVSIYPAAVSPAQGETVGQSFFSAAFRERFLQVAQEYPTLLGLGRFKGILEVNRYAQSILTGRAAVNHCRAGAGYFTASPDGSVHPCHRLVGDPGWDLGPFDWGLETAARLAPWQLPVDQRPECASCHLRYLCGGGCKQQALIATGNLLGHDPRVCAFSHLLFESALNVSQRLTAPVRDRLAASFRELAGLFVLCGQVTLPNHRILEPWPADPAAPTWMTLEDE